MFRAGNRPTVRDGGWGASPEILPETGNDQDQSEASGSPGALGGTPADPRRRATGETEPADGGDPGGQTWSNTVDRAQKEVVVDELGRIFADSGVVVVAHYEGLSVAEMTDFRLR